MASRLFEKTEFLFTFANVRRSYESALEHGYRVLTCEQCARGTRPSAGQKVLINRVDIDATPKKTRRLAAIYRDLGIPATFFVRLHANEYNPFSFEHYRCLRVLREAGHEIGLHSEIVDQAAIWGESPDLCLRRDLNVLCSMLSTTVHGVASHGGMTGLNNLDFWQHHVPAEFGLLYEAYDDTEQFGLFRRSLYVSDSNWTRWKCYDRGALRPDDHRTPDDYFRDGHDVIYLLIHPETFFDEHFYE